MSVEIIFIWRSIMKPRLLALLTLGGLLVAAMGFAACGGGERKDL